MIDKPFKIQPVAAFYKLLAKNFLFILPLAIVLSILIFFIIKQLLVNALGVTGIKEMAVYMENQSTDMMAQTKAMKAFILKYPNIVEAIFGSFVISLVFFSYLFFTTQLYLKNKSMALQIKFLKIIIPDKRFLNILLYLVLIGGLLTFASGFIALSIAANPIIGGIAGVFLAMIFVRNCLFIPGLIIGEMNFMDSLKYSFQTISLGRAFKIMIFGTLIFIMLSFILSALLYFPSLWFPSDSFKMYFNILVLFLMAGCISVGMASLFLRYGNFEEENIAE